MVYFRKRKVQRRKNFIRRSKGSGAQSKQILTNLRSIEAIKQAARGEKNQQTLQHQVTNNILTDTTTHALVPVITGSASSPAWGTTLWSDSPIATLTPQATCGRVYCDMVFQINSEKSPVTFTVTHFKMNKAQADFIIAKMGLSLSLIDNLEYMHRGTLVSTTGVASLSGITTLNPKYFRTVKKWQFTLSAVVPSSSSAPAAITNLGNTQKHIKYSFPTGYRMGTENGDWSTVSPEEICKNEHYNFIMVNSDNQGVDLAYPSYSINAISTVTAVE